MNFWEYDGYEGEISVIELQGQNQIISGFGWTIPKDLGISSGERFVQILLHLANSWTNVVIIVSKQTVFQMCLKTNSR
uniref:Uncharacterized protein n=1 Tax=Romanomermis culicivorax TaxID=13658 RepID=A0A915K0W9_ROMCU